MEKFPTFQREKPNTLKSEHLKEGIIPIMACVGFSQQIEDCLPVKKMLYDHESTYKVDYKGNPRQLAENGFKNGGKDSYVISPVDNFDKFSPLFFDCTGIVVSGKDKDTGKFISFLSHEDPKYILNSEENPNSFAGDFKKRLEELKSRTEEGTRDAVIFGGNYFSDKDNIKKNYLKSIELLSHESLKILGFEPIVITGPKMTEGADNIFYDNEARKIFIVRPEVGNDTTQSYLPSEISEQEKKWNQQELLG